MSLQDILSCINPGLPAALVKCLYLLVCIPARENFTVEETFQEQLTQVSGTWLFPPPVSCLLSPACIWASLTFAPLFSGSAAALSAARQRGEAGGDSGAAVSDHRPHLVVGPDQHLMAASGLPCPQSCIRSSNKQHGSKLARWPNCSAVESVARLISWSFFFFLFEIVDQWPSK